MKIFSRFRRHSKARTSDMQPAESSQASLSSKATSEASNDVLKETNDTTTPSTTPASTESKKASTKPTTPPRQSNADENNRRESFEMVKRRVRAPVAIFDRPLMTEVEFIVDARYRSVKVIGSGSFGVVASAYDTVTRERVAIKKILSAFSSTRSTRYVLREVRLLRHLNHPNIVNLLDIDVPYKYRAWDEVYIVTPLLKNDLRSALNDNLLPETKQRKKVAYDLLCSLEHMHSLGLMHRDIKSRNLLLDDDLNAHLCDLGHSRFYSKSNKELDIEFDPQEGSTDEPDLTAAVTTMIQSAPEISLGADYDVEVDIWAAGCVIAEIVHPKHETLFDNTGKNSHIQEIFDVVGFPTDDDLKDLPEHASWYLRLKTKSKKAAKHECKLKDKLGPDVDAEVIDLLTNMLKFSPKKRMSAKEALQHSWFDEVRQEHGITSEPYDFGTSEPSRKATKSEMKELMWKEVVAFHPEAPMLGVH